MPLITSISVQEKNKKRCNLFINGEFYAGISLECALKYRLKKGLELSQNELTEIILESNKVEALSLGIKYVTNALKTKKQVKTYLLGKGYSEEVVWYCIDKLKEYKYIDDAEYAKRYIESVSKNQGTRLTEYKLMMKGVKKEDIAFAYSECDIPHNENAFSVAEKHIKHKERTKENLSKTYRYLIGRGFSYEEANFAISKLKEDS
ncbi:MAG: RecX family transcriptional regulator [Clostridia bacterium]|nr:RecX family transcriptional regulator [Clostridia bacterium]